uniref:Uncharacterized protein n=1 Tax=Arundo donax TaxID=35708 RepID=A0A0A9G158_ARUDO
MTDEHCSCDLFSIEIQPGKNPTYACSNSSLLPKFVGTSTTLFKIVIMEPSTIVIIRKNSDTLNSRTIMSLAFLLYCTGKFLFSD